MFYTRLVIACDPEFTEILMAEISEAGFDTMMETESGFEAFCEMEKYNEEIVSEVKSRYAFVNPLELIFERVEKKNWNEEWEKNVEPIIVDDRCLVRAEFHRIEKKYPYEIIITPKMSFGTGHHQTTYLMLQAQLDIDHKNKNVMDAGCGTAILSIMAAKRSAGYVDAFDIDEWSVVNGQENLERNNCTNVAIRQGKISELSFDRNFDLILANINKNILLDEMNFYAKQLTAKGQLLISGFYEVDIPYLEQRALQFGLRTLKTYSRENWASILFGN